MKDRTAADEVRLLEQLSTVKPSPEAVKKAVERTRDTLTNIEVPAAIVRRDNGMCSNRLSCRMAAAITAVLAVAIGGVCLVFFAVPGPKSAFARVQAAIDRVPCMTFSADFIKAPAGVVDTSRAQQMVDLPRNRVRCEFADGERIHVTDHKRGVSMALYPTQKRAVVVTYNHRSKQQPSFSEFLKQLRNCDADAVEELSDGCLNGQPVERYRVLPESAISGGIEMLVYVDSNTHLPVQIEYDTDKVEGGLHVVCKDFSYDRRDPSLFEVVPPKGYQVERYSTSKSGKLIDESGRFEEMQPVFDNGEQGGRAANGAQ
ncbi:MAG: hypothetical protein ACQESR_14885 [Planctomycetota bacterium]